MPAGGSCNVAVLDGHALTSFVEYSLLFRPNMDHRNVESVNASLKCVHQPREPCLQLVTLPSVFGANPVSQLRDDNGASVSPVLLHFEPGGHPRIAVSFGRLANDVCIQQPT